MRVRYVMHNRWPSGARALTSLLPSPITCEPRPLMVRNRLRLVTKGISLTLVCLKGKETMVVIQVADDMDQAKRQ
jgi:hypothetical protein